MKRWSIRILSFIGLTAALYIGTFVVLSRLKPNGIPLIYYLADHFKQQGSSSSERFADFDPKQRWDVIIIGSSHAYQGYDPAPFLSIGVQSYDLGSLAQTPLNTYHIIKQYLDSSNCRLLIFDVYEGAFQGSGLESTADLSLNMSATDAVLGMAWDLQDLRALNLITLRLTMPKLKQEHGTLPKQRFGFISSPDSAKVPLVHAKVALPQPLEQQFARFEACLRLCRERGIRVVVSSHYARVGTDTLLHERFARRIESTLAGSGIPYLDYSFAPGISDLDNFADHSHLNAAGARIFTGHLVDSLEALGYLPSPH